MFKNRLHFLHLKKIIDFERGKGSVEEEEEAHVLHGATVVAGASEEDGTVPQPQAGQGEPARRVRRGAQLPRRTAPGVPPSQIRQTES